MAGRNWRDEERHRDDYRREEPRNRPGYEGGDVYGRSRSYQGGDWGSDRGGGPGDYGQDFARNVRRDNYGDRGHGDFQPNNPFAGNRSFDYDDSNHPAGRSYRRDPSRSGEWGAGRDYSGYGDWDRERGGAFWNSDADNRGDWERNRRNWSGRDYGRGHRGEERGFWDRASDEVASWFGDDDAERRRHQDHQGRGPRNYTRSSDRIRDDVNDRLTDDRRVDASDVEVTVSGTEVTLSGTVASRDQRRRAEDIAESVSGVTHVQNNLRVKNQDQSWSGSGQNTNQGASGGIGTLGSTTASSGASGVGGVGSTGN